MNSIKGILLKGIGGFYYVKTADGILECRAKGIFRKRGVSPKAGDSVLVEGDGESDGYIISEIAARKNSFSRPSVANVDHLFLVSSTVDPKPNILVLDKLIALSVRQGIKPEILLTKTDLEDGKELRDIYERSGFSVFDLKKKSEKQKLLKLIQSGVSVFVGNSGVGKTTLLNEIIPNVCLETGETSKKLGRGRHTTRAVELYEYGDGYIADTPGFSAIDFEGDQRIKKEELALLFPEFSPYVDECFFTGCSHTVEKGCAVLCSVAEGKIEKSRHESYCALYKVASEQNDWE